jgi:rhomboid family GlyGly-CTERM serine protease
MFFMDASKSQAAQAMTPNPNSEFGFRGFGIRSLDLVRRLPPITLLLVAAAVTIALVPSSSSCLVYDRSAILSGEVWRMFTGHWIHFSTSHLVYDSVALGIAGWIIETQKLPNFGWLCLLVPWIISGVLLAIEPQMQWFGGLSALATTAVVYLALFGLGSRGPWRWACLATLLGIVGKIIFECTSGGMIFVTTVNNSVAVSAASHIAGVLIAVLVYGWTKLVTERNQGRNAPVSAVGTASL